VTAGPTSRNSVAMPYIPAVAIKMPRYCLGVNQGRVVPLLPGTAVTGLHKVFGISLLVVVHLGRVPPRHVLAHQLPSFNVDSSNLVGLGAGS